MDAKLKKIRKNLDFYKKEYDGAMIIFRVGDSYKMYNEDAEKAGAILGLSVDAELEFYFEYLPRLQMNGCNVVMADMIDIEDDDTTNDKPTKNTKDMNEKTINNIKAMEIATEVIKALKGELPATLADYLYDAIGELEVIKIKHKLNLTPNRSEIAYLIEQAEINRGE